MTEPNSSKYSSFNEAPPRFNLIDPSIKKEGWNLSHRSQTWFEVPIKEFDEYLNLFLF